MHYFLSFHKTISKSFVHKSFSKESLSPNILGLCRFFTHLVKNNVFMKYYRQYKSPLMQVERFMHEKKKFFPINF